MRYFRFKSGGENELLRWAGAALRLDFRKVTELMAEFRLKGAPLNGDCLDQALWDAFERHTPEIGSWLKSTHEDDRRADLVVYGERRKALVKALLWQEIQTEQMLQRNEAYLDYLLEQLLLRGLCPDRYLSKATRAWARRTALRQAAAEEPELEPLEV